MLENSEQEERQRGQNELEVQKAAVAKLEAELAQAGSIGPKFKDKI